jgi:hypothetical protein
MLLVAITTKFRRSNTSPLAGLPALFYGLILALDVMFIAAEADWEKGQKGRI